MAESERHTERLLYTQAEAAAKLGVSVHTFVRQAQGAAMPFYQIGCRRKFKLGDVEWLRRQLSGCIRYPEAFGPPPPPFNPYFRAGDAGRILSRSRSGAKMRGKACDLTLEAVQAMIDRSAGFCEITGIPFSDEVVAGKCPWSPSMDRADSALGYGHANCRLVCYAVNLALNEWGDGALLRIARALVARADKP